MAEVVGIWLRGSTTIVASFRVYTTYVCSLCVNTGAVRGATWENVLTDV